MLTSFNISILFIIFFITLLMSIISGLVFLNSRIPLLYVRIHIWFIALPPLVAFIGLIFAHKNMAVGIWYSDVLSWLMSFFVLIIGVIIQRYCVRYLMGDRSYRKYFTLFTLTTSFAAIAWLTGDLRIMVISWGLTLACLTILISLTSAWKVTKAAAKVTRNLFLLSWIALLIAVLWIASLTGEWQYIDIFTNTNLSQINGWERFGINLLIILAVIIPAAQWPFQRWLIESVAAPTPVSAIMHAGIVNAGGIMLTRFSPLFNGDIATLILLFFASVSVLMGAGISLVHADYKRLLVGSTIGQMGFMLIQCALGAYIPAIIHLILHGLFKATLFLRSGSAVRHFSVPNRANERMSYLWIISGRVLALLIGLGFWLSAPEEGYRIVSGLILAWSLSVSWTQLVAFGEGKFGRIIGLALLIVVGSVYYLVHHYFSVELHTISFQSAQPPTFVIIVVAIILLLGSVMSTWVARHRSSTIFSIMYLWLVRLGDAKPETVERHPNYLKKYISKGGH
ncbi:NADH dehydrogenase subunit 5 [Staphylococcus succinus]|uniref:Probable inorganic carbon transporter subunit DabB n=1 Tax=Staphylococcus succinus TaxID=61015 RepID=A0A9Q6HPR8_9STAP|nr:NADH dehydrogenase subunit 5 [Staphylococcus succinus]MEB8127836.1 NADH dehydrogenase subunit 5 [Staphylococcus succinus]MEB8210675.1 NADH dehydrogenase subunit 5 [Staphylococcus succinus]PTI43384.1 NADH dehydrogenase subunit 5 [Staphylococcus succinus]PTI76669.1 NADH dehydrogenase subunit 5 [Staphylococcus succinus]PTJ19395.1 NADH dehydrogenase subunit 5 [Staphylococcus succinus]